MTKRTSRKAAGPRTVSRDTQEHINAASLHLVKAWDELYAAASVASPVDSRKARTAGSLIVRAYRLLKTSRKRSSKRRR
jgi:hypothetical protein